MRRSLVGLVALLLATPALAQMAGGMGGGMGGGGMDGGMGSGPEGSGPEGSGRRGPPPGDSRPKPMPPIPRAALDEPVKAMFRAADGNHDGIVTLAELEAVIAARREAIIRARFERIDSDHDGHITMDEFMAWQKSLGSVAAGQDRALTDRGGPVPETVGPELGVKMQDRVLAALIEPLSAMTIVDANTNYDAGVSLDELLALERKRFDAADSDRDGQLSVDEVQEMMRKLGKGRDGPGGPGGPPPGDRPGSPPQNGD